MRLRGDDDLRVCGGTVEALDRHTERIIEQIAEAVPANSAIDYVFANDISRCAIEADGGCAIPSGSRVLVFTRRAPHLHEVAHAAHFLVWPHTRGFLYEGFADLFGDWNGNNPVWDDPNDLDIVFASAERIPPSLYRSAWIFTSRLVRAHGVDGLREFWHSVPRTPGVTDISAAVLQGGSASPIAISAADVHEAYRRTFGDEAVDLVTPENELDLVLGCVWVFCEEPIPWAGTSWRLDPPMPDCENDVDAVGPVHVNTTDTTRYGTVELEPGEYEVLVEPGGVALGTPCGHECVLGGSFPPYTFPSTAVGAESPRLTIPQPMRWKMQTLGRLDEAGHALTIRRLDP